jgi:O-antigen/teichoic acid export membrane protein
MALDLLSKIRSCGVLFRRPANAAAGDAGRSGERYRRAFLTTVASLGSKGISFVTSILTVRWTLRYLGTERYGMWVTISSFVLLLSFADLGLGNGLLNVVAEGTGREDREAIQRAVSSAFWILSAVAALLLCAGAAAYPFLHPERILNVHSTQAVREAGPALAMFFVCFVANLPLGAVSGTRMGLQQAYISSVWSIAGAAATLAALWIAINASAGLPVLILALLGPGLVTSALNGFTLFGINRRDLWPSPAAFSMQTARRLLRIGLMFFILQIAISVAIQTDNLVIAQIKGADAVAVYAVPGRMFSMANGVIALLSFSMWPAFAEASARSDRAWIRKGFRRVMIASMGAALVAVTILTIAGNRILALWVGPQMHASHTLLLWFALQGLVLAYMQPIGVLLNGLSQFRLQVKLSIVMAGLNLALSILCVREYGIAGAAMGTVISFLLVQVVPFSILVSRLLAEPRPNAAAANQAPENP